MSRAKPDPDGLRSYRSGHCNRTVPITAEYNPHASCSGGRDGYRCVCECHTKEESVPEPTRDLVAELATSMDIPCELLDGGSEPMATGPSSLADLIGQADVVAGLINAATLGYHHDDWRDAVRDLYALRGVVDRLRAVDAVLVEWLYRHGEHGQHQVIDGVGAFSVTRGRSKERWASAEGVEAYVTAKMEATGGEFPDPLEVMRWVLEVLPATTSTSLRKTALREAGLDVGDYYASEPGTVAVSVPKRPVV